MICIELCNDLPGDILTQKPCGQMQKSELLDIKRSSVERNHPSHHSLILLDCLTIILKSVCLTMDNNIDNISLNYDFKCPIIRSDNPCQHEERSYLAR
ncbi:hypothetical protein ACTXT7_003353 [Hymenolepis weldensis]